MHAGVKTALAAAVALAMVVLLAACGGDDDAATTTTGRDTTTTSESTTTSASTTTTTTTTLPPISTEQQAIAQYNRYNIVFFEAAAIPDPDYPALAEVATGLDLARAQDLLIDLQNRGLRVEGRPEASSPTIVSVSQSEIVLVDCYLEDSRVIDVATGAVTREDDNTPESYRITMVNENGAWKVEEVFNEEQPCTPA
ncbi:MAG: hypothetical protein ACRD0U_09700 [Acidimicrobiales bacterium]